MDAHVSCKQTTFEHKDPTSLLSFEAVCAKTAAGMLSVLLLHAVSLATASSKASAFFYMCACANGLLMLLLSP